MENYKLQFILLKTVESDGECGLCVDLVEGLGDSRCRRRCLLPRVQRHDIHHERRGREPIHASTRPDHPPQRPRHQEPLRDPLRPREHQSLHAGRLI